MSDEIKDLCEQYKDYKPSKEAMTKGQWHAHRRQKLGDMVKTKERVNMRMDKDVLEAVRELAGDGSYQALITILVREALDARKMDAPIRRLEALADRFESTAKLTLRDLNQSDRAIVIKLKEEDEELVKKRVTDSQIDCDFGFIMMSNHDRLQSRMAISFPKERLEEVFYFLDGMAQGGDTIEVMSISMPERHAAPSRAS